MNQTVHSVFGPEPKKLLLAASTGGHLAQLVRMAGSHGAREDSVWVTFESPQSKSLLKGKDVLWVDYIAPRDLKGVISAYKKIRTTVNPEDFEGVLSTGASLAISAFTWAKRFGVPSAYIESCSRTNGPSLTGRITHRFRLANTYTQHSSWASGSWRLVPSVMGQYQRIPGQRQRSGQNLKLFVSLGTIKPYRFDRLIDKVLSVLSPDDEITWQVGETTRESLAGKVYSQLEADQFLEMAKASDVVITHAGMGTILQLLDEGISPIVIPREKEHNEHIDNHQSQIWNLLLEAQVGIPVELDELDRAHLTQAFNSRTVKLTN